MAAGLNPLERAFQTFLTTLPPDRLEELLGYARETQPELNNIAQAIMPAAAALDAGAGPAGASAAGSRPAQRARRLREGRLRPLNSFIAFRSFYSVIFPELTQKVKSGILKFLWQNDPFKAKWAILAKAYSTIRDEHAGEVSLDTFLALNIGFIGIHEPDVYLRMMGWQLDVNDQGQYTMTRVQVTTITEAETATNYSVNDIVRRCYETGYVPELHPNNNRRPNNNGPVMSFAAQPNIVINENNTIQIASNNAVVAEGHNQNTEFEMHAPTGIHYEMHVEANNLVQPNIEVPVGQNGIVNEDRFFNDFDIAFNQVPVGYYNVQVPEDIHLYMHPTPQQLNDHAFELPVVPDPFEIDQWVNL